MRIIVAHSRYLSGDASGENRVVEDEIRLLSEGGHEVAAWEPEPEHAMGLGLVRTGAGAIWSRKATHQIRRLVRQTRAEVVHLHNLFPMLSPAVIRAASVEGAAVVMTLHNYRLSCLPSTYLRDGRVCEDCLGKSPVRGIVHRCYRGSFLGSATLASSLVVHRAIGTLDDVDLFLPVGGFVRDKHIQAGFPADRLRVKSNFASAVPVRRGPGHDFVYVGRLSSEKGLEGLLEGWPADGPRLRLVGDGPEAASLQRVAPPSVEFVGPVPSEEVTQHVRQARALLLPSICYEGQPRSVLEALAAGVPVLGSAMGGIVDLVDDGVTGFLLRPGDPEAWVGAARALMDDDRSISMGEAAHRVWRERFSPEVALSDLEEAYAIAARARRLRARVV